MLQSIHQIHWGEGVKEKHFELQVICVLGPLLLLLVLFSIGIHYVSSTDGLQRLLACIGFSILCATIAWFEWQIWLWVRSWTVQKTEHK